MSENQKCLNLIRGGGGSAIFKNVWNSKKSEISEGGGVKPIWEFFPNFFVFFYDGSPKEMDSKKNMQKSTPFGWILLYKITLFWPFLAAFVILWIFLGHFWVDTIYIEWTSGCNQLWGSNCSIPQVFHCHFWPFFVNILQFFWVVIAILCYFLPFCLFF